ncbi:MAG: GH25 family lysozyme [Candidatus Korobacteraceae bacterium]
MDGRARGIDVSHFNTGIDWSGVAAAGVTFAFAKASQGADPTTSWYTDPTFAGNWPAMKAAGIIRGAYHFVGLPLPSTSPSNWNDDIHSQVDHFLAAIGPLQSGDLPPALDFEDGDSPARWKALISSNRAGALAIVREFIAYTTAQLGGTKPIIYTGNFWWGELGDPDPAVDNVPFSTFPLWFSQYPIDVHVPPLPVPGPPGSTDQGEAADFTEYAAHLDGHQPLHIPLVWGGPATPVWQFWQFSEFGRMPGLMRDFVDLNVFNGSVQDLQKLCIP